MVGATGVEYCFLPLFSPSLSLSFFFFIFNLFVCVIIANCFLRYPIGLALANQTVFFF